MHSSFNNNIYLKPIQFDPGIEINEKQLIKYFKLTGDKNNKNAWFLYEKGPTFSFMDRELQNKPLSFLIEDNQIKQFGSGISFEQLKKLLCSVPDDLQPIKSQLNQLLLKLEIYMKEYSHVQEKVAADFKKNCQIISKSTPDFLRRKENILLKKLEIEYKDPTFIVNEHGFIVKNIPEDVSIHLGTSQVSCCKALIIYNPVTKKIGLTHIDYESIEGYRKSLESFFNQCQGSSEAPNYVYIIGSNVFDTSSNSYMRAINLESQTLLLSLYHFINERKDCILEGTSSSLIKGNVLVSILPNQKPIIYTIDDFRNFASHSKELQKIACDIAFQELVDYSLLPAVKTMPTKEIKPISFYSSYYLFYLLAEKEKFPEKKENVEIVKPFSFDRPV